jgi:hypothetical protein
MIIIAMNGSAGPRYVSAPANAGDARDKQHEGSVAEARFAFVAPIGFASDS